jgi:type IV pilus assembly protein PilB
MNLTLHRKPLGELLVGRGAVGRAQLELALMEQRRLPVRRLLGEILVESRLCSEEQVAEALADSYGVPFIRLGPKLVDPKVVGVLPRDFVERELVLPLFLVEDVLTVAVVEPANVFLLDEVRRLTGHRVQPAATTAADIRATLAVHLPGASHVAPDGAPDADSVPAPTACETHPEPVAPRAPEVYSSVHLAACTCFDSAIRESATDIHFEPDEAGARVRFRVDGRLMVRMRTAAAAHQSLVSHLKSMAGIGTDSTPPANGVIRVRSARQDLELFLSVAAVAHGEKAVVRINHAARPPLRLEKLGFGYETLKQWRRLITSPTGLLLVAGPAGSGKRTTLCSSLAELDVDALNVCMVGDGTHPSLPGVNHFRAGATGAVSTADGLHAALTQEPDVIMLPEMADSETARLAVSAAAGGRLVLCGVHTPDPVAAVVRLLALGVQPYLLGSALAGVLCQRLVRRLCAQCREAYDCTATERKQLERHVGPLSTLYRPKGCPACRNTGYAGRIGFFELLVPSDLFGDAVCRGAARAELAALAQQARMKSLPLDGAEKVKSGITTLTEYLAACTPA